ncbi:MFS transporter [Methanofollis formosanus]|uniref:MFS transporter n=1 Tax=Methanofollis formosanus TaxID=299308 RepID=A0A8G1A2M8_9EURY|nr:MFS transporter [Methanofollis formosanus]QYZ79583.1 MFS transporter [Methanofollis formosanus]
MQEDRPPSSAARRQNAFRLILILGVVSLLGDIVSNGARSVTGPYLLTLGGSAAIVGLVAGIGEFTGYGLRVLTGLYADQTRHYWRTVYIGYGLLIAIPFLAVAATWEAAALLIVTERVGKAIRAPARDTIISLASFRVGRGWGVGVHKALDQVGAIIGPLVLSAAVLWGAGYEAGFAMLALPIAFLFVFLFIGKETAPTPAVFEKSEMDRSIEPRRFVPFATFLFLSMAGFASFPLISYHMKVQGLLTDPQIPLVYALAMTASTAVALVVGWTYDRVGTQALLFIPCVNLAIPVLAFGGSATLVILGTAIWGAGVGLHETVMRAALADRTATDVRGQAFGFIYAVYGAGWFLGSTVMGVLYEVSVGHIIGFVVIVEILAGMAYLWMRRGVGGRAGDPP